MVAIEGGDGFRIHEESAFARTLEGKTELELFIVQETAETVDDPRSLRITDVGGIRHGD